MPASVIMQYLHHAQQSEIERYAWDFWRLRYPFMLRGQIPFQSFGDYVETLSSRREQSPRDPQEIEAEMTRVVAAYEAAKGR